MILLDDREENIQIPHVLAVCYALACFPLICQEFCISRGRVVLFQKEDGSAYVISRVLQVIIQDQNFESF